MVIVGGGFGGLYAARALRGAPVEVTLFDRQNHHVFSPLLYQVATAQLAPGEIAQPLRALLRNQSNTRVLLGEAIDLDLDARTVRLADGAAVPYDSLIVATGTRHSWFGHDDWEPLALLVLVRWAWSFATRGRSNRLITGTMIADDKET